MAEYYRKEEVLKAINDIMTDSTILHKFRSLRLRINRIPTADVVEVVHGEWIVSKTEFGWNCCEYPVEYKCSVCGRTEKQEEPYCHCGAKMEGEIHNDRLD